MILALWAASWVMSKTRARTPGLPVDSAVYLSTADSLRGGGAPTVAFSFAWDGYTPAQAVGFHGRVPATHFPPGYPAALAAASFIAGSVRSAARLLDVVLVAANILLVGWLTARMTAYRSVVVATVPAVLLLFGSDHQPSLSNFGWLNLHRMVASEPLFTALFTIGLIALGAALTGGPSRARAWLIVALMASMAALFVRYIGVALVLTSVVGLVAFDREHNLGTRLRRAGVFAGVAVAPTLLFVGWAMFRGAASPRPIFFRPVATSARLPLEIFARFIFPPGGPHGLRLFAITVVIVLVVIGSVRGPARLGRHPHDDDDDDDDNDDHHEHDDHGARSLMQLGLLGIATYVVLMITARTLFDINAPIDARLLAPIRGIWYAVVVAVAYRALVHVARGAGAAAVIGALTALLIAGGWNQQGTVIHQRPAQPPARSPVDEAISRVPPGALIVSNEPDLVYDRTGRSSISLPTGRVYNSNAPNPDYERESRQLIRILAIRGGYLAVLPSFIGPVKTAADLRRFLELDLVAQNPPPFPKAHLYKIVARAPPP
jgi:hypothetical protein